MSSEKTKLDFIEKSIRKMVVSIDSVSVDPANARRHPERNLDAIAASIRRFGQQKPIVVDSKGCCIAGSGTLEAMRDKLGHTHIAAITSVLAGVDRVAYSIADNRTAEMAEWEEGILADMLESVKDLDPEALLATGYTDEELMAIVQERMSEAGIIEVEAPEPPDDAITQPGELIILGEHRLLCGDSSSVTDVDRLLGGEPINLVNTDPPYNVKVEPRSNNAIAAGNSSFPAAKGKHHQKFDLARHPEKAKSTHKKMRAKDRPLENDFVSDEAFEQMLHAWFGNMARVLVPGGSFYIWGGYANCGNYPPVMKAMGLYFSQAIIWHKLHPVLTRKDFMGDHEWCFYGWREGAGHKFYGENNVPDVWPVKKINPQSMIHLTEKPIELAARAIRYSSKPGANVLDLFGGSGSTLMAAEQTGRRSYLMEIDPPYCDVIIQRWENFTKKKAKRKKAPSIKRGAKFRKGKK